jgi:hypothetical protein
VVTGVQTCALPICFRSGSVDVLDVVFCSIENKLHCWCVVSRTVLQSYIFLNKILRTN